MQTNYLLPHKYKIFGWILFIMGIISGVVNIYNNYESNILICKVWALYSKSLFGEPEFFKVIENSVFDEIIIISIIVGGLLIGFTKEKIEDEFIYKLRKDSLVWAIIFNYIVLIFAVIFVFDLAFFNVLVFNIFTPLLFFIIRFNFLKLKSRSDEE